METSEFGGPAAGGAGGRIWRAIDASANRAGEALRVLEDVVRFGLDDYELTRLAKNLRHELATILARPPFPARVVARDVAGDVGTDLQAAASPGRGGIGDLVAANAARAAQALRSLQESAAVVAADAVAGFERIRYRLYALERAALVTLRARDRLAGASLCVLVDGRDDQAAFERLVDSLFEAGVRLIQVRDKSLPAPALAARVAAAVASARRWGREQPPLVIVNDRVDVAVATGAAGAHVGANDLPVPLARRVLGPDALLGRTAHDTAEARAAVEDGADYLGIGPCFPSATKTFAAHATPEFLGAVATGIALPAFAIGGITLERLEPLVALGVTRVAVAAAVTQAADPSRAARDLIDALDRLTAQRRPEPS
jgi:thiamine-phosphate pyrophosphorylase